MRVIAIDPGEMTGWAIGYLAGPPEVEGGEFSAYQPNERPFLILEQFGYDPWKVFSMTYLDVMLGANPFKVVVYESFRIRAEAAKALTGSDVPTAQGIGIIKAGAWRADSQLVTSEPMHKPVIDKQMGGAEAYLPGRDQVEHYRDAVRHLYWWAVNKRGVNPRDTRRV